MKKILLTVLLILGTVSLSNCGTVKYIPAGSQSLGIYWGQFSGISTILGGIVRIHLYQTADGTKLFTGSLEQEGTDILIWIKGKVVGNSLEGTFLPPITGTLRGELAEDGGVFTGTFETMNFQDGTWTAKKE